mgnify:CR=1 FL=1
MTPVEVFKARPSGSLGVTEKYFVPVMRGALSALVAPIAMPTLPLAD